MQNVVKLRETDWAVIQANQVVKGCRFSVGHSLPTRDKIAQALRRERVATIKGVLHRLLEGGLLNGDLERQLMALADKDDALQAPQQ